MEIDEVPCPASARALLLQRARQAKHTQQMGGLMRTKALAAEFIGTFMLVASVLGAALFSFPIAGIVGVALSIGFSVMAMIFAVGYISGGHFNPAVTLGLVAGKRFAASEAPAYIAAQCLGGIAAAVVFYLIASGKSGGFEVGNFASTCTAAMATRCCRPSSSRSC